MRLLLLLATLLLAGCLFAPKPTAHGLGDRADTWAQTWNEAARLVRFACVEGPFHPWMAIPLAHDPERQAPPVQDPKRGGTVWNRGSEDGDVGDGRCHVASFQYVAPGTPDTSLVFLDAAGRNILTQEERDATGAQDYSAWPALGKWTVDSDDAVRRAKETNERLRDELGRGASLVVVLDRLTPSDPLRWRLDAGREARAEVRVIVDPVTGEASAVSD